MSLNFSPRCADYRSRLDLGCGEEFLTTRLCRNQACLFACIGSGSWILECANLWPVSESRLLKNVVLTPFQNCKFVGKRVFHYVQYASPNSHRLGLDLVPLHPNLSRLPSSDLSSRITWTQTNWLVRTVGLLAQHG
jgi:hypothetical protein